MNTTTTLAETALHEDEIPLGAHLVTPRRGYVHHGIYVGTGHVVHYMGLSAGWRSGPVEEVTLEQFASGHAVTIRSEAAAAFAPAAIAHRAKSRLGENRYGLLSNNCEHFSTWCVHGVARSAQVDRITAWPRRVAHGVLAALSVPITSPVARLS